MYSNIKLVSFIVYSYNLNIFLIRIQLMYSTVFRHYNHKVIIKFKTFFILLQPFIPPVELKPPPPRSLSFENRIFFKCGNVIFRTDKLTYPVPFLYFKWFWRMIKIKNIHITSIIGINYFPSNIILKFCLKAWSWSYSSITFIW